MTDAAGLERVGISAGQRVRFRRRAGQRWHDGVATRLERDGSIGVRDAKGAARAVPMDRVEVRTEGPRGAVRWVPLTDLAAQVEQRRLF